MDENILHEFKRRLIKPWEKSGFGLYFVVVVILFGGIGIWLSILRGGENVLSNVSDNMFTYSIALFVPAFISIVLPPMLNFKHKLSWIVLIFLMLFIEVVLVIWSEQAKDCLVPAIISTLFSWAFWIIANSENQTLADESYDNIIKNGEAKHGQSWNNG